MLVYSGCELQVKDPETSRARLGTIDLALVSPMIAGNTDVDLSFDGVFTGTDTIDTTFALPSGREFHHFIALAESTSRFDTIYYNLPADRRIRIDSGATVQCFYRKHESGFALILKMTTDSLICFVGTLMPDQLNDLQNRTGAQGFRIISDSYARTTRNTDCGREGDFDMTFISNSTSITVPPASAAVMQEGSFLYYVANVSNTRVLKQLNRCPDYDGESNYLIIRE